MCKTIYVICWWSFGRKMLTPPPPAQTLSLLPPNGLFNMLSLCYLHVYMYVYVYVVVRFGFGRVSVNFYAM